MSKNKIDDLRDHLFAQLERLGDEDLKGDALETELRRSEQVAAVAREITASAKVEVDFLKVTGQQHSAARFFDKTAIPPPSGKPPLEHEGRGK